MFEATRCRGSQSIHNVTARRKICHNYLLLFLTLIKCLKYYILPINAYRGSVNRAKEGVDWVVTTSLGLSLHKDSICIEDKEWYDVLTWKRERMLGWKTREWSSRREWSRGCGKTASREIRPVSLRLVYRSWLSMPSSLCSRASRNGPARTDHNITQQNKLYQYIIQLCLKNVYSQLPTIHSLQIGPNIRRLEACKRL